MLHSRPLKEGRFYSKDHKYWLWYIDELRRGYEVSYKVGIQFPSFHRYTLEVPTLEDAHRVVNETVESIL